MTTWISKPAAALGLVLWLGACDAPGGGADFFAGLAAPLDTALPPPPLTQALMMREAVTLVPPRGYCIDPDSLTQRFALMARCDTLGADTNIAGSPLGIMTVSFAKGAADAPLPQPQEVAQAAQLSAPEMIQQSQYSLIFRADGSAPTPDLAAQHWRSVTRLGPVIMGAALFGPDGQRAVSSEGAELMREMIRNTLRKSEQG